MTITSETYREEIRSSCPKLSEKEISEAADSLLRIFQILAGTVQNTPELQILISNFLEECHENG